MSDHSNLKVKVWGDWACFTRPDLKVERVTYEVMTPAAALGILESIFWKPAFQWRIQKIHVLKPIRRVSLRRTEVTDQPSLNGTIESATDPKRTRRNTLALRDVAYIIEADIHLVSYGRKEDSAKYRAQFRRCVSQGRCFHRPYLGCREFAAYFGPPATGEEGQRIDRTDDLGRMFFGWRFQENHAHFDTPPEPDFVFPDQAEPVFFDARLEEGTLTVPQEKYNELLP